MLYITRVWQRRGKFMSNELAGKYIHISDDDLELKIKSKSQAERNLTVEVIELLDEIEARKIYLRRGYGSLIEYCIKELKYSESSSYRRISAMRLARELPEVKLSIESGDLNLVTVSQVQTFFRAEEKNKKTYSKESKAQLLAKLQNKSSRETEKLLFDISPDISPSMLRMKNRLRVAGPDKTQVTLIMSNELLAKLDRIKNLVSHKIPDANYVDVINYMADLTLIKLDPTKSNPTSDKLDGSATRIKSRYIPAKVKRQVWTKSNEACSYHDLKTGKICGAKKFLEIDHIIPFAHGGANTPENLRILCGAHNRWLWDNG